MKRTRKTIAKLCFIFDAYMRSKGINLYYPYQKLLNYKNKYKNRRCFIIGTGPSLDISSLRLLNDEITFSMNSIILSFKDVSWRPTYYVVQDNRAYNMFKNDILKYNLNTFIGIDYRYTGIKVKKQDEIFNKAIFYPLYVRPDENIYKLKFSEDCYNIVYDGTTTVYSILQLAIYMGFQEIYLLGIDCDYSNAKKNIINYVVNNNSIATENKMMYAYMLTNEFAKIHDVKIYNVSNGKKRLDYIFEKKDISFLYNV